MTHSQSAIVAIGSELTAGRTIDTNSAFLSKQVTDIGAPCVLHVACPDDLGAMVRALKYACSEASLVLVTGGLGPTDDDLTRDAVAELCGRPLIEDESIVERIRTLFKKFGRVMPESNRRQGQLPEGCELLFNEVGTAPGFHVRYESSDIYVAPGVPREMKHMWATQIRPRLEAKGEASVFSARRQLRSCGVPESQLGETLAGIEQPGLELAYAVKEAEGSILMTLTARDANKDKAEARVQAAYEDVQGRLGAHVCGLGDETLFERLASLLEARGASLALLEGELGGVMTGLLTQSVRALPHIREARLLVHEAAQRAVLESSCEVQERATALAQWLRRETGASYALVALGPGTKDDEEAFYFALEGPEQSLSKRRLSGLRSKHARERNRTLAAASCLDLLRRTLETTGA